MANPKPVVPLTPEQRQMVEDNINLAYKFASRFRGIKDIEQEDVKAICLLALTRTARSYDPQKATFSTFAYVAMKNEILMACRSQSVRNILYLEDIGRSIDLNEDERWEKIIDGGTSFESEVVDRIIVSDFIETLSPPQKQVFALKLQHPDKTFSEIASMIGVSRQNVSQIVIRVRPKLQEAMAV